jgi:hypothetical protein
MQNDNAKLKINKFQIPVIASADASARSNPKDEFSHRRRISAYRQAGLHTGRQACLPAGRLLWRKNCNSKLKIRNSKLFIILDSLFI